MTAIDSAPLSIPAIPEDPTIPFGALELPDPAVPVSAAGLERAYAAMLAYFGVPAAPDDRAADVRAVGKQIDKAYALAADPQRWELTDTCVILHSASGATYHTRPDFCAGPPRGAGRRETTICPGFSRGAIGCYHQLAVELLRLAQIHASPADAQATTPLTLLELPGFAALALFGAISIVQRNTASDTIDIAFDAASETLAVAAGGYHATAPAIPAASWYLTLSPTAFGTLWSALKPVALQTEQIAFQLAHAGETGTLTLTGGALTVAVPVAGCPL